MSGLKCTKTANRTNYNSIPKLETVLEKWVKEANTLTILLVTTQLSI